MLSQRVRLIQIAFSLEAFRHDNGQLPTEEEGIAVLGLSSMEGDSRRLYLDPEYLVDLWGRDVSYRLLDSSEDDDYDLISWGPNGADDRGKGDDISLRHGFNPDAYEDYTNLWLQIVGWFVFGVLLFYMFRI